MSWAIPRDKSTFGLVPHGERVQAYTERAFHHFLEIERERCSRSGERCFLVLAELKGRDGSTERMTVTTSETLFRTFSQCLRETDFLGWHIEGHIAGAVLTEVGADKHDEAVRRVIDRIRRTFEDEAPVEISSRLHIGVSAVPAERACTRKARG
jgi:hypothetical protein